MTLANADFDISSSMGFTFDAYWDFIVFHGDVNGSISSNGEVKFHGTGTLGWAGFNLNPTVDVDLNPAGTSTVDVGASLNVFVANLTLSSTLTYDGHSWPQPSFSVRAGIGGALAKVFSGTATFTVSPSGVVFDGTLGIPSIPGATMNVHGVIHSDGTIDIPGFSGNLEQMLAQDLATVGKFLSGVWKAAGAQLTAIASGLKQDLPGLSDSDLVSALNLAGDANAVKNALTQAFGAASNIVSSLGGAVNSASSGVSKAWHKAFGGYAAGGVVFLDENFNGSLDPGEPSGFSDSQGGFYFEVPVGLVNGSGTIDDSAGQWVVQGGTDLVTGLPEVMELMAPGSWYAISALTTLVSLLSNNQGFNVSGAESQTLAAFGLPSTVDLSTYDPVGQTLAGDSNGPLMFAAQSKLENTIAMVGVSSGTHQRRHRPH